MINFSNPDLNLEPEMEVAFIRARTRLMLLSEFVYSYEKIDFLEYYESLYPYVVKINNIMSNESKKGYRTGHINITEIFALYSLVKYIRPNLVLETGVSAGVSSYFILKALNENGYGTLMSLDLPNYTDPKGYINKDGVLDMAYTPKELGVGWLVPEKYKKRWKLLVGDSLSLLPNISEKPDIFFHDSDHSYSCMFKEFMQAYKNGTKFILSDDINWNDAWSNFQKQNRLKHIELDRFGFSFRLD